MNRYRALRAMRCDPVTAAIFAVLNWLFRVPRNQIRVMHITIELDQGEQP